MFRKIGLQLRATWFWLAEARHAWLALFVIVLALAVIFVFPTEPIIRWTGLVLQLLGIATVSWGISETRALFGHPSYVSKIKAWIARFPVVGRPHTISVSGVGSISLAGKVRVLLTHGPVNSTVEARVDALEKNVKSLSDRVTATQEEMEKEFQKTADALKQEEKTRLADDDVIRNKLETTGTGGVHISAIGASWLFVGVTLGTVSVDLASFLAGAK